MNILIGLQLGLAALCQYYPAYLLPPWYDAMSILSRLCCSSAMRLVHEDWGLCQAGNAAATRDSVTVLCSHIAWLSNGAGAILLLASHPLEHLVQGLLQ